MLNYFFLPAAVLVLISGCAGTPKVVTAVRTGDPRLVQTALDEGCNPNARISEGYSAIHLAVERNDVDVMRVLLKGGANANLKTYMGYTPLHLAVEKGRIEVAELLLSYGADVNAKARYRGLSLRRAKWRSEMLFAEMSFVPVEHFPYGHTPFHIAVQKGEENMVDLLLSYGADPEATDNYGKKPFGYLILNDGRMAEFLISRGAQYTIADMITAGATSRIRDLIALDPRLVYSQDKSGTTALHYAVRQDQPEAASVLLAAGADPNARDKKGYTALHRLTEKCPCGREEEILRIANLLTAYGADISPETKRGKTPLLLCRHQRNWDLAAFLISQGAPVTKEVADMSGFLDWAVKQGNSELAQKLRDFGAVSANN